MERVYDALERHCDMSRYWNDPDFHCFRRFPPSVRAWPVTQAIESQMANGGLPQLLWNSFPHWRALIDEGIRAYEWMGAAAEAEALRAYRPILERCEETCRPYWESAVIERSFEKFREWMEAAQDHCVCDGPGPFDDCERLSRRKEQFLETHLKQVLQEIRTHGGN